MSRPNAQSSGFGRLTREAGVGRGSRIALVACAMLAIGGTTAWATGLVGGGFVGSDGSITACVHNNDGNVRLLDPSSAKKDLQSCKNDETRVTFSQQGQKGDTGPQGPAGTLTTASQLNGVACTTTAGATGQTIVSFDSGGNGTLSCNTGGGITAAACGDGVVQGQTGEQCDSGGVDSSICDGATCKVSICGNGHVNAAAGEQCDTGGMNTATCNGYICTVSTCGDGYVNPAAGEQCDDGNMAGGDGCSPTCRFETP